MWQLTSILRLALQNLRKKQKKKKRHKKRNVNAGKAAKATSKTCKNVTTVVKSSDASAADTISSSSSPSSRILPHLSQFKIVSETKERDLVVNFLARCSSTSFISASSNVSCLRGLLMRRSTTICESCGQSYENGSMMSTVFAALTIVRGKPIVSSNKNMHTRSVIHFHVKS